jgi:hypothetical protein
MEKRNLEQLCAIKFCVKLNENATETYENLKWAYGEHALSRAHVFRWHKAFLDGHEIVDDEKSKNEQIEHQIHANLFFRQSRYCS